MPDVAGAYEAGHLPAFEQDPEVTHSPTNRSVAGDPGGVVLPPRHEGPATKDLGIVYVRDSGLDLDVWVESVPATTPTMLLAGVQRRG